MAVVRVVEPFAFSEKNGVPRVLRAGDLIDEKDPCVKRFPHFFEAVQQTVDRATYRAEQATAAPGERRMVKPPKDETPV